MVSEVLGNGAALVLTVVLVLLIVRTARSNFAMWLGAFCALLWIGGSLTGTLLIQAGAPPQSSVVWITHLAGLASGVLLPISFLMLWPVPEPAGGWRVSLRRWLLILAVGLAALAILAVIFAAHYGMLHAIMPVVPFDAAILMTLGALIVLPGRSMTFADRAYMVLTLLGMWACGVAVFVLNHFVLSPRWCALLTVVKEQAPFLTLMGTIFFFARFRAADVLIKSALKITAGTALAVAGAVIIPKISSQPMALLLLTNRPARPMLLLLYLAASSAVEYAVDRWVLPRPDYRACVAGSLETN